MRTIHRAIFAFVMIFLCLSLAHTNAAQTATSPASIDPSRFPKDTVFYVLWRGAPSQDARAANSLYALWDDPGFAPARNALFDSFLNDSHKSGDAKSQPTRDEISEYTTLLENPMAIGFVTDPEAKSKSSATKSSAGTSSSSAKPESTHKWNGFFLVYDRTGKEALLAKALLGIRTRGKEQSKLTPTTISGLPALKIEHKVDTDYWLESGKYVISSGEPAVIEQLIRGLKISTPPSKSQLISQSDVEALQDALRKTNPNSVPPSNFLGGVAAFKEAGPVLGKGALELFVNVGDAIKLAGDAPTPQGIRPSMVLDSMKMNMVHSFSGTVFLDGAKTRFQGGILGDTSAGSLFDIWDNGQAKPASIAYISPSIVSYRETNLNLPAIYALAVRIATPFFPKGQTDPANMLEAAAQIKLGMTVREALGSLTGEFGALSSSGSFDFGQNIYFVGVRDREYVLKMLRRAFLDNISADVDEDGVTYITLGMAKSAAGQANNNGTKFHLAVTKDIVLVAGHRESLKPLLAQSASSKPPAQLAPFFANHGASQGEINGLNFMDLQKFDWSSLRDLPGRNKATGTSVLLGFAPDKSDPPQKKSWLDEVDPKVFTKHLHLGIGYSWKDASGLHFDGWID